MPEDVEMLVLATLVYCGLPLILAAEAWARGARWFRTVTTILVVAWFCVMGLIALQEWRCAGSSLKGLGSCDLPILAVALQNFPALAGIPLVIVGYFGAVIVRIAVAILRHLRGRAA